MPPMPPVPPASSSRLSPGLRRDLRSALVTLVVLLVVAALWSAAPSRASYEGRGTVDADTVDGFDAVGAGAGATRRRGKLVATDAEGRVPDAGRLDGRDGTSYASRQAVRGEVMTGVFSMWGEGEVLEDSQSFRARLPAALPASRVTVLDDGGTSADCPGIGRVARDGQLCVYTTDLTTPVRQLPEVYDVVTGDEGVARDGIGLTVRCQASFCAVRGTWAVRAR